MESSMFLVLTVIGVVMILAGIARMHSRRQREQSWDEIDHSVLFNKSDDEPDGLTEEPTAAAPTELPGETPAEIKEVVVTADQLTEPLFAEPDQRVAAERSQTPETSEQRRTPPRRRSLFSGLRAPKETQEAQLEIPMGALGKGYKEGAPEWVILLSVMAPEGQFFHGSSLIKAIEAAGLQHGAMDIFHFEHDGESLFSLVNMVNPGSFDLAATATIQTPGVSLFVQLPGVSGMEAFERMLNAARELIAALGGELRDDRRSVLTQSAIKQIRERIVEYDMKWQIAV